MISLTFFLAFSYNKISLVKIKMKIATRFLIESPFAEFTFNVTFQLRCIIKMWPEQCRINSTTSYQIRFTSVFKEKQIVA